MAEAEAPIVAPPPIKQRSRVTSRANVEAALIKTGGDRKKAAEILGMKFETLKTRIHDDPYLKSRWNRHAMVLRAREAALLAEKEGRALDPATVIEIQLTELSVSMGRNGPMIVAMMEKLQERITNGELARESDDAEFVKKWAFKQNVKGEPSEEAMLREEFRLLMESHREDISTIANVNLKKAQAMLMLKRGGFGGKPNDGPNRRPKFNPRVAPPGVVIQDSKVIIQSQGENGSGHLQSTSG